jgi:DNA repair protein RecO (recombination protein O)
VSAPSEPGLALVLRSTAYGEADRIVTLLTRRHGKLSAVARSARNSKRRFAGSLEGFALISAEIALGSGDLARLQSARVVRAFPAILSDLPRMTVAGALLRLARDLIPERTEDDDLFDALVSMLEALERSDVPPTLFQLAFQARLLALTGFAPLLTACGACGKVPRAGRAAEFDPLRGCVVCQSCGGAGYRMRGVVRQRLIDALEGDVIAVAQAKWLPEEYEEASLQLSLFIAHRIQRPGAR